MLGFKEDESEEVAGLQQNDSGGDREVWDEHDSASHWDQMREAKVEFKEPLDGTLSIKIH